MPYSNTAIPRPGARAHNKPGVHHDQSYGRYTILRREDAEEPELTEVVLPSNEEPTPPKPKRERIVGPGGTPRRNEPVARRMAGTAAAAATLMLFAAIQPSQKKTGLEAKRPIIDLKAWADQHLKAQEAEARFLEQRQSRNMAQIWSDLQKKRLSSDQADQALAEALRREVSATPSCQARRDDAFAELRLLVTEGITDLRSPLTNPDSACTGLEGKATAPPDLKELYHEQPKPKPKATQGAGPTGGFGRRRTWVCFCATRTPSRRTLYGTKCWSG